MQRSDTTQAIANNFERTFLRVGLIATAVGCWEIAIFTWDRGAPASRFDLLLLVFANYLLGFGLLFAGALRRPARWLSYLLLVAAMVISMTAFAVDDARWEREGIQALSDVEAFADYAGHLLWLGENPYQYDLTDGFRVHRSDLRFTTPTLDGSHTGSFSYPALGFLIYMPFQLAGVSPGAVNGLFFVLTLIVVFFGVSPTYRPLVLLPTLIAQRHLHLSLAGINDIIWVFFLCLMILSWRAPSRRAIWFGIACAFKQQPWLLAPFLLIKIWRDNEADRPLALRQTLLFALTSLLTFAVFNLPFLLWSPTAWFDGIFAPYLTDLVILGQGLAGLTTTGFVLIPKLGFTVMTGAVAVLLLVIYYRYYSDVQDTLWIFPGIILFFGYRSLDSYWFFTLIPLLFWLLRRADRADVEQHTAQRSWRWATVGVVLVTGTVIGVVAFSAVYQPPIHLSVQHPILTTRNQIDRLRVTVENRGDRPITPRFAVQVASRDPVFWDIDSGPLQLLPQTSATYEISTGITYKAFDFTSDARVFVSDADDYGLRAVGRLHGDWNARFVDSVANGQFAFWDSFNDEPLLWDMHVEPDADGTNASITPVDHDLPFSALALTVSPTTDDALTRLNLTTDTLMPDVPWQVWVKRPPATGSANSDVVYGLELLIHGQRRWMLFGDTTTQGTIGGVTDDDGVVDYWMLETPVDEWTAVTLDFHAILSVLDAEMPIHAYTPVDFGSLEYHAVPTEVSLLLAGRNMTTPITAEFGEITPVERRPDARHLIEQRLRDPAPVLWGQAQTQLYQRNFDVAGQLYLQLSDLTGSAYARQRLAHIDLLRGDFDSAREQLEGLIADDQLPAIAYRDLARTYIELGEVDRGLSSLEQALTLFAESPADYPARDYTEAYILQGELYLASDRCFEGAIALEQAQVFDPDYDIPYDRINACGDLLPGRP